MISIQDLSKRFLLFKDWHHTAGRDAWSDWEFYEIEFDETWKAKQGKYCIGGWYR